MGLIGFLLPIEKRSTYPIEVMSRLFPLRISRQGWIKNKEQLIVMVTNALSKQTGSIEIISEKYSSSHALFA